MLSSVRKKRKEKKEASGALSQFFRSRLGWTDLYHGRREVKHLELCSGNTESASCRVLEKH